MNSKILIPIITILILSSCTKKTVVNTVTPESKSNNQQLVLQGVIRHLNLPANISVKYSWQNSQYILEEYPTKNANPIYYALFSGPEKHISSYLNSCVQIVSTPSLGNKKIDVGPYNELIPLEISKIEASQNCQVYPLSSGKIYQQKIKLTGQLQPQFRPAFNLPEDYFFTSKKPFTVTLLNDQKQTATQIVAIPATDTVWQQFNQQQKKDITITGSLLLGKNDIQILQIDSITTD